MFSAMDPVVRTRILETIPGTGFDSELKINATLYRFAPMRFGAEAYRHHFMACHGFELLCDVLAGRSLAN